MRLRIVFYGLCLVLLSASTARGGNYSILELPMFGNVEKTEAQKQLDRELIQEATKDGSTREAVSREATDEGFWYLFKKQDYRTAMHRFNQAWILDPDNPEAYWGFALVTFQRDKDAYEGSRLFDMAVGKGADSSRLYMDWGMELMRVNKPHQAIPKLKKALKDPKYKAFAYKGLIQAYMELEQYEQALDMAEAAKGLHPWFEEAAHNLRKELGQKQ